MQTKLSINSKIKYNKIRTFIARCFEDFLFSFDNIYTNLLIYYFFAIVKIVTCVNANVNANSPQ